MLSAATSAWLTASHPNSEVKQVRAGVVLRWGTTREGPVLRFFCTSFSFSFLVSFLEASRFSLCSPSFYGPLSLGHMHMHVCLVVVVVVVFFFSSRRAASSQRELLSCMEFWMAALVAAMGRLGPCV
jgi:hypothetical protein